MTTLTLVTLTAWLLLATSNAHPQHQVYYHGVPEQQGSSFIYVPQADAASVARVQQYSAPVGVAPPATQYVLLYPGAQQDNLLPRADEEKPAVENPPTIWNLFNVFRPQTTTTTTTTPKPADTPAKDTPVVNVPVVHTPVDITPTSTVVTQVEETTPKSAEETPVKPEKIVGNTDEIMVTGERFGAPSNEQRAALENLDETIPQNPQIGDPSVATRQYMLVQRPQFFGNYNFLKQGNMQQSLGIPPGVSNFLLYRNGFVQPEVVPASSSQSGRPLKLQEEEAEYRPGVAALNFQKDLEIAKQQQSESQDQTVLASQEGLPSGAHFSHPGVHFSHPGVQPVAYIPQQGAYIPAQGVQTQYYLPAPVSTEFVTSDVGGPGLVSFRHNVVPNQQFVATYPSGEPPGFVNVGPGYQNLYLISPRQAAGGQGVVVEADSPKKGNKEDSENVDAEQAGPSVAQAKPQAIALAGVGGVAAAAPIATAVVGSGGLAVSAPSATAVAGPSGGGTLVGPAHAAVVSVNKHLFGVTRTNPKQDGSQRDRDMYEKR